VGLRANPLFFIIFLNSIGSPTSIRDKVNSQYISGCNPHLTSRFCGVELGLKPTFCRVELGLKPNFDSLLTQF